MISTASYSHDRLLQEMYKYVHNNYPEARGLYFHVNNECRPYPGESKRSHIIRLSQAKAIGTLPGVMDHLFYFKGRLYAFDAKVGTDRLGEAQAAFIANLKEHGGNGWEVRSMEAFKILIDGIIKPIIEPFPLPY